MRKFFLSLAIIGAFYSCDENDILESTGSANFTASGLPTLPTNYVYQTWLLVGGSYVSLGTFNIDSETNTSTISDFSSINNNDLTNATGVAVTVEYTGSEGKSSPSDLIILAGNFSGNTVDLVTTDSRTIYANDLKADYIIDAPTALTSEKTDSGQNGIWFSTDISQTADTFGLLLPYNQNDSNRTASNLIYQTWLYEPTVADNSVFATLNMGTFTVANSTDNLNSYAGTNSAFTPVLPGNDFINVSGLDVSETIEILNKRVIITAKPNEESATDTSPFAFTLFDGTLDTTDGTIPVSNESYTATFTRN